MALNPHELPAELWNLHTDSISDESLRGMYAALVTQLQTELATTPGFGVVEAMMAERVAYLYTYIRDKERLPIAASGGFAHDRVYKETTQLWHAMAQGLSKAGQQAQDTETVREHILEVVGATIKSVLETFPKDQRQALTERFSMAFEDLPL